MKKETQGMLAGFAGITIFASTLPVIRHAIVYLDPVYCCGCSRCPCPQKVGLHS